jgi:hypothetical protein
MSRSRKELCPSPTFKSPTKVTTSVRQPMESAPVSLLSCSLVFRVIFRLNYFGFGDTNGKISAPPSFEIKLRNQTSRRREPTVLQCEAKGEKPIGILWNMNNKRLDPKSDSR